MKNHLEKAFLPILFVILFLASISLLSFSASETDYIIGDADDDGEVSVLDVTVIQRIVVGVPYRYFNEKAADVDFDDDISVLDATFIQRYLIESYYPYDIIKNIGRYASEVSAETQPSPTSPEITVLENASNGIHLSWTPVEGVEYYAVFSRVNSWVKKDIVSSTEYTDTAVYSGTEYTYKVRCCSDAEGTAYTSPNTDTGPSILYLKLPQLKTIANVHEGVRITFSTVAGADCYEILRKTTDSSYSVVGTAQARDGKFTDTTAERGTEYTYTVRACHKTGDTVTSYSAYDAAGLSILAQDESRDVYVNVNSLGLYTDYTDESPALSVKYMTPLTYLETTTESAAGSWMKVKYNDSDYYLWQGADDESKLTDTPSDYSYETTNTYQRDVLATALSFLNKPTGYAHGDSTGVANEDGKFYFDCSGFVAYVCDTGMNKYVPTYDISANINTLYKTTGIYNEGYNGAFSAQTVIDKPSDFDESKLQPGDVIFFDLTDENEEQSDNPGYNHCGLYLGKNEFIHCTHSWGGGVCVMPLSGFYADHMVAVRRYLPAEVQSAGVTKYTTSQMTKLYSAKSDSSELIETYGADVEVTLLYTDNGNWDYVFVIIDGKRGFILNKYLTDTVEEVSESKFLSKTSIKLYDSYSTDSSSVEVLITTPITYHGRYSNSSYYKVSYNGSRYYIYAPNGIDSVLCSSLEDALTPECTRFVNANTWVRSSMSSQGDDNKLTLLYSGKEVQVIEVSDTGTWSYIRYDGNQYGFILSSKLSE